MVKLNIAISNGKLLCHPFNTVSIRLTKVVQISTPLDTHDIAHLRHL